MTMQTVQQNYWHLQFILVDLNLAVCFQNPQFAKFNSPTNIFGYTVLLIQSLDFLKSNITLAREYINIIECSFVTYSVVRKKSRISLLFLCSGPSCIPNPFFLHFCLLLHTLLIRLPPSFPSSFLCTPSLIFPSLSFSFPSPFSPAHLSALFFLAWCLSLLSCTCRG